MLLRSNSFFAPTLLEASLIRDRAQKKVPPFGRTFCGFAERGGQFSNSLYEDLVKLQKLSEELEKELQQADFDSIPESSST